MSIYRILMTKVVMAISTKLPPDRSGLSGKLPRRSQVGHGNQYRHPKGQVVFRAHYPKSKGDRQIPQADGDPVPETP